MRTCILIVALLAALPSVAQNCTFGTFGPNKWPDACWTPFAPAGSVGSVWNAQLPASPQLSTNSAAIVSRIVGGTTGRPLPDELSGNWRLRLHPFLLLLQRQRSAEYSSLHWELSVRDRRTAASYSNRSQAQSDLFQTTIFRLWISPPRLSGISTSFRLVV